MMPRPFDDHEPHCRRELRHRHFRPDDPRIDEECRCNARWIRVPERADSTNLNQLAPDSTNLVQA